MIAAVLTIPMIPLWVYPHTAPMLAFGGFLMQFMIQGAWGVIPAHLNELSPPAVRGTFPGLAYQLGNLLASRNSGGSSPSSRNITSAGISRRCWRGQDSGVAVTGGDRGDQRAGSERRGPFGHGLANIATPPISDSARYDLRQFLRLERAAAAAACPLPRKSRWRRRARWTERPARQFLRELHGSARDGLRPSACPRSAASG